MPWEECFFSASGNATFRVVTTVPCGKALSIKSSDAASPGMPMNATPSTLLSIASPSCASINLAVPLRIVNIHGRPEIDFGLMEAADEGLGEPVAARKTAGEGGDLDALAPFECGVGGV